MDETFNSIILRYGDNDGDHNYDDSNGCQMVRLIKEGNSAEDFFQTDSSFDDASQEGNGADEYINKETTMSGSSTTTWAGSKPSVAIIYPCNLCDYETFRSTSLVAHLRQHRQDSLSFETERFQIGKFVCNICNFKTRWLSSLKEHEQKAHFNNNNYTNTVLNSNRFRGGPHNCRLCGYSVDKLETIGIHMRRHFTSDNVFGNIIRSYPCCLCEFTSRKLDELQNHFNDVHYNSFNDNISTCDKCDHIFNNHEDLIAHLQKHEEDSAPEYPCDFCSHRSASILLWRDHMESHGGVLEISLGSVHR